VEPKRLLLDPTPTLQINPDADLGIIKLSKENFSLTTFATFKEKIYIHCALVLIKISKMLYPVSYQGPDQAGLFHILPDPDPKRKYLAAFRIL
jgi:hypothetical protein